MLDKLLYHAVRVAWVIWAFWFVGKLVALVHWLGAKELGV